MSFTAPRLAAGLCAAPLLGAAVQAETSDLAPRQRLSIDAGWRFTKGDPGGAPAILLYDIRPDLKPNDDAKAADARPEEAVRPAGADQPVLKPWILPSGNAFIRDPAKRFQRPAGDPGGSLSYVQAGFDDKGWQSVTLPHDWAIAGPFLQDGPYESGWTARIMSCAVIGVRARGCAPFATASASRSGRCTTSRTSSGCKMSGP